VRGVRCSGLVAACARALQAAGAPRLKMPCAIWTSLAVTLSTGSGQNTSARSAWIGRAVAAAARGGAFGGAAGGGGAGAAVERQPMVKYGDVPTCEAAAAPAVPAREASGGGTAGAVAAARRACCAIAVRRRAARVKANNIS